MQILKNIINCPVRQSYIQYSSDLMRIIVLYLEDITGVARRYEFYVRVARTISLRVSAANE